MLGPNIENLEKVMVTDRQNYWNEVTKSYPVTRNWKVVTTTEVGTMSHASKSRDEIEIVFPDVSKLPILPNERERTGNPTRKRKFITLYSDDECGSDDFDRSSQQPVEPSPKSDSYESDFDSSSSEQNPPDDDDDEDWNQRRRSSKQRRRSSKRKRNLKCQICPYVTKGKLAMKLHVQKNHSKGDKPFKCRFCSYSCSGASNLNKHLRTHTGEKPFKCPMCPYESASSSNMSKHIRNHVRRKGSLSCDICTQEFPTRQNLEAHVVTHAGLKPYQGRVEQPQNRIEAELTDSADNPPVKLSSQTESHLNLDKDEKQYPCHLCPYKCISNARLKSHLMTHTGEKPFPCAQCSLAFRERGSLTRHMRVHTGEKPYKCHVCPYSCRVRGNLKQHILIHTGEMPHKCPTCEYKCRSKTQMNKHVSTIHVPRGGDEKRSASSSLERIVIEF